MANQAPLTQAHCGAISLSLKLQHAIGFSTKGVVREVDSQEVFELGVFEGILAGLPVLGAIYFYGKYRIDRTRHEQNLQQLASKRTAVEHPDPTTPVTN